MPDGSPFEPNPSYVGLRTDLLGILPPSPRRVLDVGCATGAMGRYLADTYGAEVWGIEYDGAMAELARASLRAVFHADLNRVSVASLPHEARYDLIVCGDVLEHLVDPWTALRELAALLAPGGRFAVSLPNVGHYTTLVDLALRRSWPLRDRGIHDRTHLRFFTRKDMLALYACAGLRVVRETRKVRLVESGSFVDALAHLFDVPPFRSFVTFQYVDLLARA